MSVIGDPFNRIFCILMSCPAMVAATWLYLGSGELRQSWKSRSRKSEHAAK